MGVSQLAPSFIARKRARDYASPQAPRCPRPPSGRPGSLRFNRLVEFSRSFIVVGFVLVCVVSPVLALERRSIVVLPEKAFEFGSVAEGTIVAHDFEIRNEGSADLQIQRIAPSCGCTAAAVTSPLVKPGSSEKIRVQFDTTGFSGSKFKQVHVFTSDRDQSDIIFTLRGTIISEVKVSPNKLDFGELSRGSSVGTRTQEFAVSLAQGSELKFAGVTSSSPSVAVKEIARNRGESTYRVEVLPSVKRGELRERVIVRFAGDSKPALNIPVIASVLGDVALSPSVVSFGVVSGSESLERRVQWRSVSKRPVRITRVQTSDPAVTVQVIDIEPGRQGVLAIRLNPEAVNKQMKATVTIGTDSPDQPELVLAVYAVRAPK
jgi:hypothetical protein